MEAKKTHISEEHELDRKEEDLQANYQDLDQEITIA